MANTQTLGIAVQVEDKGAQKVLLGINASLEEMAKKGKKAPTDTNQAIANLVDGLRFVNDAVKGIVGSFEKVGQVATAAFVEAETAMTDVNIVIGRTGELLGNINKIQNSDRRNLAMELGEEYAEIEKIVSNLARTTEFSYSEIARLFKTLKQSGLNTSAITMRISDSQGTAQKSILESTLALASASRGVMDLSDAAKTLVLSSNSLGSGLSGVAENADRMLRMINNADVGFEDLKIMMESMSGAGKMMFEKSSTQGIMTVLAALKTAGKSAAESGQYIVGLGRSVNNLMGELIKTEEYKKGAKGFFTTAKGKKAMPRKTIKAFALARLGLTKESFVDKETGKLKGILEIIRAIRTASDKVQKDATAYKALTGKKLKGKKLGKADALALVYKALGTQQASQIIMATELLEDRLKQTGSSITTMEEFSKMIGDVDNDAMRAQKTALSDNRGATKLLESAMFSLNQRIGEVTGNFDTFKKKATKNYVSAIDQMLRSSDAMNGTIGGMIEGIKILGKIAVATSGVLLMMFGLFQITAGLEAAKLAASASAGKSLGILGALKFELVKLLPMLAPIGTAILAITALSFVISKLSSMSSKDLGFFGEMTKGMGGFLKVLTEYYLPVLMGKDITDSSFAKDIYENLNSSQKQTIVTLAKTGHYIKEVLTGMTDGIAKTVDLILSFIMLPLRAFMYVIGNVLWSLDHLGVLSDTTAKDAGNLKQQLKAQVIPLRVIGSLIGGLIGIMLSYKLITIGVNTVTAIGNGLKKTYIFLTSLSAIKTKALNKVQLIGKGIEAAFLPVKVALASATLFQFFAIGLLAAGILLCVGAMMYLWNWHSELMENQEKNYWVIMALRAGMVLVAIIMVVMIALLAKMIVAGFGVQMAFWPVVLVIGAVVGIVALLGYGIYKLLSWMGLLGDSADGMGEKFGGLGDEVKKITGGVAVPKDAPEDVVKATTKAGIGVNKKKAKAKGKGPTAGLDIEAIDTQGVLSGSNIKVPGLDDLTNEGNTGSQALAMAKGTSTSGKTINLTVNVNHKTNVDKLDGATAAKISKQLGPLIVDDIKRALT